MYVVSVTKTMMQLTPLIYSSNENFIHALHMPLFDPDEYLFVHAS